MQQKPGPIGVFDSGYGGLTVFKELLKQLPEYDYIYLGDNARVPYGTRSYETVYAYTLECVNQLFNLGCNLVILACNTASAKALRSIQQKDLPQLLEYKRVLGVIRPTAEVIGKFTKSGKVGVLATEGTISSESYIIETATFWPEVSVFQEACPMWVPLVENNEYESDGADFFVKKNIQQLLKKGPEIDAVILACTHYPLLVNKIKKYLPAHVKIVSQAELVAESLQNYMHRHPKMDSLCTKNGGRKYFTTETAENFCSKAKIFLGKAVEAQQLRF